jgi:hypothetical protein
MLLNRRTMGLSLAALVASPVRAMIATGGGCGGPIDPWWNLTAASPEVNQIMAGRVRRLHPEGIINPTREQVESHVRSIFPQVIEQGFAQMSPGAMAQFMRDTSDRELAYMAANYRADLDAQSSVGRLLPVVATLCDSAALTRWSAAFGTMPVYEALARFSPGKLPTFERSAASRLVAVPPLNQTFQPNIDMTIGRIYQGFRTAPIGASSVAASIYQTSAYAGAYLTAAYAGGYALGTYVIAPLIQTFAPALWDGIGKAVYDFANKLEGLTGIPISQGQKEVSYDFGLASLSSTFEQTGGDYGAVAEWSAAAGYGGGGC